MDNNTSNSRIAKNTIMLYIRMVFVLLVNLYISRIVLRALGIEDYGLYSVVGSVVSFLGFLNTSMAAASQRFLSYQKGKGNEERLSVTFNSIVRVQWIIAIIVFLLCETLGVLYIAFFLKIDPEKLHAAHIVFQFSIASILVNTITVPYNASIIANERMGVFTVFSIADVLLKLFIAHSLFWFRSNVLIFYAGLMFICMCLIQGLYRWYCRKHFNECKLKNNSEKDTIKEILHYSWWNLFGSFSHVAMDQGVNMVLNSFFGVVVNAARGIAFQVSAALAQLYSNFQQALTPQIVKSYASDDLNRMHYLIAQGTRLSFFLLYIFAVPIIFNIEWILKLWLGEVPEYTSVFCVLVIVNSLINSMSQSLMKGAMATTNIRKYQIIVSSITLLNLPLSILILYVYPNPYITVFIMIFLSVIAFIARLILAHHLIYISVSSFIKRAIVPVLISVFISIPLVFGVDSFFPINSTFIRNLARLFYMFIVCFGVVTVVGVNKEERSAVLKFLKHKIIG